MSEFIIHPSSGLNGKIKVPGDKSISHRAIIFASLAEGQSKIKGLLLGEDVLATMKIFQQLGVKMSHQPHELHGGDELVIDGVGIDGLRPTEEILDCGNSGTSMRLLLGLLAGQNFKSTLTGDESLNSRPMDRVINPLTDMGAKFEINHDEKGRRLITVHGTNQLQSIDYTLPVASAQLKSALLLGGMSSKCQVVIRENKPSRDHTERFLGANSDGLVKDGLTTTLNPISKLTPFQMTVPTDFSSAAFFLVAGLIVPNSEITLKEVGLNPTRSGLLKILLDMGGEIEIFNEKELSGEPVADLKVKTSDLSAVTVEGDIIPNLIDELPILFIAATQARGKSFFRNIGELRVKESDRLAVMSQHLKSIGAEICEGEASLEISGPISLKSGDFNSFGDHRIAMSMAVAGLIFNEKSKVLNTECVATSFPNFYDLLSNLTR